MPRRELSETEVAKRKTIIENMRRMIDDDVLTPGEVALLFRVHPKTVSGWVKTNRITFVRTPGGHRRYRVGVIRQLMTQPG
jgi:excisionase family DNA binding protein